MTFRTYHVHIRYALLAVAISAVLWGMSHNSSSIERGYDIPVAFYGMSENLVITGQNTQVVNIRVLGPRAALREISPLKIEYAINLEGARAGESTYEVDETLLEMPTGARILSRSPSTIELTFERRSRKTVRVTPDLEGEPAEGYVVAQVEVDPPRVWLAGARSEVLRLTEVVTETIDLAGLTESLEREVRLTLGGAHVWVDEDRPVKLRIQVDPIEGPDAVEESEE